MDRLHGDKSFGQTKFQKIIVLAEYLLQLREIDSRPRRFARGPHDPELIEQVEHKMKDQGWFQRLPRESGPGWRYVPLYYAGAHRPHFEKQWPDKAAEIRGLIDSIKSWDTDRCERFATVYAAWNDLLLWDRPATDDAILKEVLENWHPDKEKIPLAKWRDTLEWMRRGGHIPTRFGRATQSAPSSDLLPL